MEFIVGSLASFSLFHVITHPRSKFFEKSPVKKFKFKNLQLVPYINVSMKNRVIHFHHWMIFSPLFVAANKFEGSFLHADITKGLLLGAILQGLMYSDRFRVIFKQQEYEAIKTSQYHLKSLVNVFKRR